MTDDVRRAGVRGAGPQAEKGNIIMQKGIGISTLERDGEIVAHSEGATFTVSDWMSVKFPTTREYELEFENGEDATIHAVDDATALEWAAAKFIPPYVVRERIITWREVAEVEA
jgi:hypothetical protein